MLDIIFYSAFVSVLIYSIIESAKFIENINIFAVGRRNFSTFSLTMTIVATWVSGSGFFINLTQFYKSGLFYLIPAIFMCFSLLFVSLFIAKRMKPYLGFSSVAAIMGHSYGHKIRVITAIAGAVGVMGLIAVQFKIFASLGSYIWGEYNINPSWYVIFFGSIITLYSSFGGVQSVVKTDIIQAVCFFISIIIAIVVLYLKVDSIPQEILSKVDVSKFHIKSIFQSESDKIWNFILLCVYFLIPGMNPASIQRLTMGFHVDQLRSSWFISFLLLLIVKLTCAYIVYLLYLTNPNLQESQLFPTLINSFEIDGVKAILIIGIISMAMSTADSFLNISAVLIANDTYAYKQSSVKKLSIARKWSFIIGISAIILTFFKNDLLSLLLFANSFYIPIVTVPLLALIFNFKLTERCVIFSMATSFIFVCVCHFIIHVSFEPIMPAMLLNAVVLFTSHYIIEKWELLSRFGITSNLYKMRKPIKKDFYE